MVAETDPRPVLRQELARVFKNPRIVRAFEKIFDLIPPEFINQQAQIDVLVEQFDSLANELSLSSEISSIREQLQALNQKLEGIQQGPII